VHLEEQKAVNGSRNVKKKYFGWLRPLETRIRPKIKPVQGYEASRKSKPTDSDNNVHSLHFQAAKHFKIHKMSLK